MSPRIFSTTQREELRIKMLDAGFELIKQHGMTHRPLAWGRAPSTTFSPPRRSSSPTSWSISVTVSSNTLSKS